MTTTNNVVRIVDVAMLKYSIILLVSVASRTKNCNRYMHGFLMNIIGDIFNSTRVGEVQFFGNLDLYPLHSRDDNEPSYALLNGATEQCFARKIEMSNDGSILEFMLMNESLNGGIQTDGEDLTRAKQNRILNIFVMSAPDLTTLILVPNIETGRRGYASEEPPTEGHAQYAETRAKNLHLVYETIRESCSRRENQGEVWYKIVASLFRKLVVSDTQPTDGPYIERCVITKEYHNSITETPKLVYALLDFYSFIARVNLTDCFSMFVATLSKSDKILLMNAFGIGTMRENHLNQETDQVSATRVSFSVSERHVTRRECIKYIFNRENLYNGTTAFDKHLIHLILLLASRSSYFYHNNQGLDFVIKHKLSTMYLIELIRSTLYLQYLYFTMFDFKPRI